MQDIDAITAGPNEDPYWDIAQNEQIATPDGPMSREELEQAEAEGDFFVTKYSL